MGILARAVNNTLKTLRFTPAKWPKAGGNLERWLITGQTTSSYTGKNIDEESALSATAVWSAVMQLSQTVASLPLHLYKRLDRGKEKAVNKELYHIMHLAPNSEMSSMAFREQQMGQVLRSGVSYAEKELDESGKIKALWPLISRDVTPKRVNWEIIYNIKLPGGKDKLISADRILRVPGFSQNGLIGYNPIEIGSEAIAMILTLEEYGARYFGNGARPDAVLEHPDLLDEGAVDRLRKSWNEIHQGLEKSHRIAILEQGMKLHEFQSDPQKAQANETKRFQIEEVARIFNIPMHMLKDLQRSTNNNIEFQGMEFVIYCLRSWLVRYEQAYTMQLLPQKEWKTYFFEHVIDGLLRGDTKTRHEAYAKGRQWGYYSANDVREMENQNDIGEQGDIYLVPLNMVPADKINELVDKNIDNSIDDNFGDNDDDLSNDDNNDQDKDNNSKNSDSQSNAQAIDENENEVRDQKIKRIIIARSRIAGVYERLFVDSIQKIVNRENIAIKKALKKHINERGVSDLREWLKSFYEELSDYIKKQISPTIRSYAEQMLFQVSEEINSEDPQITDDIIKFIDEYVTGYAGRHIRRSLSQLNGLLDKENPDKEIESRLDKWQSERPKAVAATELFRLGNAMAMVVLFAAGYEAVWRLTATNSCDYCRSLEGRKIVQGGEFVKQGDEITPVNKDPMKIKRTHKHPPLHTGCKCIITAV